MSLEDKGAAASPDALNWRQEMSKKPNVILSKYMCKGKDGKEPVEVFGSNSLKNSFTPGEGIKYGDLLVLNIYHDPDGARFLYQFGEKYNPADHIFGSLEDLAELINYDTKANEIPLSCITRFNCEDGLAIFPQDQNWHIELSGNMKCIFEDSSADSAIADI